jgi:hypothetical protein
MLPKRSVVSHRDSRPVRCGWRGKRLSSAAMAYSRSHRPLSLSFYWILAGVGVVGSQGCGDECDGNTEVQVDGVMERADIVREVVASGGSESDQCLTLCGQENCTIEWDSVGPSRDCTQVVASGGAGGSSEAGPGGIGGAAAQEECQDFVYIACPHSEKLPCEGRRHASWRPRPAGRAGAGGNGAGAGAWYARAAANEAGSVRSFRALARELRGSPIGSRFSDRLRRAARDEIRHARVMRAEALRRGAEPVRHDFAPGGARSLFEIALENAREGCVAETWAALVAHVQAQRAPTARARRQFRRIAADETRHAELAWDLHRHLSDALDEPERETLAAGLSQFIDALAAGTALASCVERVSQVGLPGPDLERALRARLSAVLHREARRPTTEPANA